jgi:hypothetical protein
VTFPLQEIDVLSANLLRWQRILSGALCVIGEEVRASIRLDPISLVLTLVFLAAFAPLLQHNTETPFRLLCCIPDEPPLSMALDGMRALPYGDPYNFVNSAANDKPYPAYYHYLNYHGVGYYYGGLSMGLAFLVYAPLLALGAPAFPTAPIILRTISLLSGLLALLITYNFVRREWGRVAGMIAGLLLLTEPVFVFYSTIIHPDATQFALSLLTLQIAVRFLRDSNPENLGAVGILCGLVQGTKLGGPWLVPMVATATIVGFCRQTTDIRPGRFAIAICRRGLALAVISAATWIMTTPYAFLEPDFFQMTKVVLAMNSESRIINVEFGKWIAALAADSGLPLIVSALGGVGIGICGILKRKPNWALLLAIVLGLSQLLWFAWVDKLWVILRYVSSTLGIMAILAGVLAGFIYTSLAHLRPVGRIIGLSFAALATVMVLGRWYNLVEIALPYRLMKFDSEVQIGLWAEAGNIPRDAHILLDAAAYFDPQKFPNARIVGDPLTYNDLYRRKPDYIVVNSYLSESYPYDELAKTQRFTMQNEGPNSMRLYQDLRDTSSTRGDGPAPTSVPGLEFVRSFGPDAAGVDKCDKKSDGTPYQLWSGALSPDAASSAVLQLMGAGSLARQLAEAAAVQVAHFNTAGHMIDALRGKVCVSLGPVIRLYRIIPPGTASGFGEAFASSSRATTSPLAAFDGVPTYWLPTPDDPSPSIGFDFGGGSSKTVDRVHIDWPNSSLAAKSVEVQFSDTGTQWTSSGRFKVTTSKQNDYAISEHELMTGLGGHRFWRVLFERSTNDEAIAVREIRFLEIKH